MARNVERLNPVGHARRAALTAVGCSVAAILLPGAVTAQSAPAKPSPQFEAAWSDLVGGRPVATDGRVKLDIPRLAESGNSVGVAVKVSSPMSELEHVRRIHLLSEQNPVALIGRFHLSPRSGVAEVETSIRLATTQNVRAVAELSDGSLHAASAEVVVLLAACLDPG